MTIGRRGFGRAAVSALWLAAKGSAAQKTPLAVQLYSVRVLARTDLAGALEQVARLGYAGVEFAGYYGHTAPEVRKMLDGSGLKAAGSHVGLDALLGDSLAATLDFNRAIGNRNLVVPGVAPKYRDSIAAWKNTAGIFREIAARIKPSGFALGYHNHTIEFQRVEGELPFDAFFGAAGNDVKVQLDIGHARQAGADPVAVINRYRDRILSVHIKDCSPEELVTFGDGVVDWPGVFRALDSARGVEWYIVEEEGKTCQGYSCIESSIQRLRKMGQ